MNTILVLVRLTTQQQYVLVLRTTMNMRIPPMIYTTDELWLQTFLYSSNRCNSNILRCSSTAAVAV